MDDLSTDVGTPDSSASIGTDSAAVETAPETVTNISERDDSPRTSDIESLQARLAKINNPQTTAEEQPKAAEAKPVQEKPDEKEGEPTDELAEIDKELAQNPQFNKGLVKKLRGIIDAKTSSLAELTTKYDSVPKSFLEQGIDETRINNALELENLLYGFDPKTGKADPTAFTAKVLADDPNYALSIMNSFGSQTLSNGDTIFDAWLKANDLDPSKLDELKSISKGETTTVFSLDEAAQTTLSVIPPELHEVYKSLSKAGRENIDGLVNPEYATDDDRKEAISRLNDRQSKLDRESETQQEKQKAEQDYQKEVVETYNTVANTSFETLSNSLDESDVFTNIKTSANELEDFNTKQGVKVQMLHLADVDTPLGKAAVKYFERLGVTPDVAKIKSLISELDASNQTFVMAEADAKRGNAASKTVATRAQIAAQQAQNQLLAIGRKLGAASFNAIAKARAAESSNGAAANAMPRFGGSGADGTSKPKVMSGLDFAARMRELSQSNS